MAWFRFGNAIAIYWSAVLPYVHFNLHTSDPQGLQPISAKLTIISGLPVIQPQSAASNNGASHFSLSDLNAAAGAAA